MEKVRISNADDTPKGRNINEAVEMIDEWLNILKLYNTDKDAALDMANNIIPKKIQAERFDEILKMDANDRFVGYENKISWWKFKSDMYDLLDYRELRFGILLAKKYEKFKKSGLLINDSKWLRRCSNGILLDFYSDQIKTIDVQYVNSAKKSDNSDNQKQDENILLASAAGLIVGSMI